MRRKGMLDHLGLPRRFSLLNQDPFLSTAPAVHNQRDASNSNLMDTCPKCNRNVVILDRNCPSCRQQLSDDELADLGLNPSDFQPTIKEIRPQLESTKNYDNENALLSGSGRRFNVGILMILGWLAGRVVFVVQAQAIYGNETDRLVKSLVSSTISPMLALPVIGLLLILSSRRRD